MKRNMDRRPLNVTKSQTSGMPLKFYEDYSIS